MRGKYYLKLLPRSFEIKILSPAATKSMLSDVLITPILLSKVARVAHEAAPLVLKYKLLPLDP